MAVADSIAEDAKQAPDPELYKQIYGWARATESVGRQSAMLKLAEALPGVAVRASSWDSDPWLLNCQNGVLDLRTGKLQPPTRELLQTKLAGAAYETEATSSLWLKFLRDTLGSDAQISYVQRALGYALFGAWQEKAFWFAHGPPDGGKSTALGIVGDVFGDYHVSAAASTWMQNRYGGGNRGDLTRLLGARLVTTLEVRDGMRFDEELMKKICGGDSLVAAAKFENDIEFKPGFALWFGANDRPEISDTDDGMWARIRCVPFTRVKPKSEQNPKLRALLTSPDHAPAILAWLVQGCLAWQQSGIGECSEVGQETAAYRAGMNRALAFFDDACELTREAVDKVPCHVLRNCYMRWCRENGVKNPLMTKRWGRSVRALGITGGDDATRVAKVRYWYGVKIRPEWTSLDDTDDRGVG